MKRESDPKPDRLPPIKSLGDTVGVLPAYFLQGFLEEDRLARNATDTRAPLKNGFVGPCSLPYAH
jgi:hypothetical protein